MSFREKLKLAMPGEISGRACISAIKSTWRRNLSGDPAQPSDKLLLAREFDQKATSSELGGLIDTLQAIRTRILANALLRGWAKWFAWLLIALIVLAAASARLAGGMLAVGVLAAIGVAAISAWIWRNRPSRYETARRLDSVAGLKDRLSTAIFLGSLEGSDGIVSEQRRDALAHLKKLDPRSLFPVQQPGNYKRAAVLVLVAAGLLAYRIHHRPPLVALLQSATRSQLVQSILAPLAHAVEKDLQRTVALMTKPDANGEETRRDALADGEDLWKSNEDPSATADDQKNAMDNPGDQQDQLQAPGDEEGSPSAEARPQDSVSQSQQGQNGNESADGKSEEESEQNGPEGRQSLGQSLLQALKNMMSNSPNQMSNNRAMQPPSTQGTPQSGNSQQPGSSDSDKRGDSRGNSDAKQKANQTSSEGAGSQEGTKELRKDQEMHPVNAVPDRVALEASGFKEETRMKVPTETGTAQMAVGNAAARQDAVTNGAEQENIPARYRFYVQRYFDHADNGAH